MRLRSLSCLAMRSCTWAALTCVCFFPLIVIAAEEAVGAGGFSGWRAVVIGVALIVPVIVVIGGAFIYMHKLRSDFTEACKDRDSLGILAGSPMGLPAGSIGAMIGFVVASLAVYFVVILVVRLALSDFPGTLAAATPEMITKNLAGVGAVLFLIIIAAAALLYMSRLQKRFFEGCLQDKQLSQFFASPAGLPGGTVRAILALIIVVVSLFLIALQFFDLGGSESGMPEALTTLLGAVVAFYFATRASQTGDSAAQTQLQTFKAQRDEALTNEATVQADTKLGKIRKGLDVVKAASVFLPEDMKKKYGSLLGRVETGLKTVDDLIGGKNATGANEIADGVLSDFAKNNPVVGVLSKITRSAGPILSTLGISAAPVTLALSVVGIGVRLGGAKYQRWKQRVLHAPLTPEAVPLTAIDATVGDSLLRNSPILTAAFKPELDVQNRKFIKQAANELLALDMETLWSRYRRNEAGEDRFESRQQFEDGVEEYRRVKADFDLRPEVPADLVAPFGGYDNLLKAVDAINKEPEAQANFDELMMVADGLIKEGQPVIKILENASKEVEQ